MTLPPVRREIVVDADPTLAFAVFTEQIGRWWPLADHSVYGADATVALDQAAVGGRIVESKDGAEDAVWGTVTRWEPDGLLSFTWHPGQPGDVAGEVTVSFEDDGGKTLVRLEHSGWEVFGDQAAEARAEYDRGWPTVLDQYAARVAAA